MGICVWIPCGCRALQSFWIILFNIFQFYQQLTWVLISLHPQSPCHCVSFSFYLPSGCQWHLVVGCLELPWWLTTLKHISWVEWSSVCFIWRHFTCFRIELFVWIIWSFISLYKRFVYLEREYFSSTQLHYLGIPISQESARWMLEAGIPFRWFMGWQGP